MSRPPVWDTPALAQWFRLSFDDAEAIARAVEHWNNTGEGSVIAQGQAFHLFAGKHVVTFLYEDDVMRVIRIRRM